MKNRVKKVTIVSLSRGILGEPFIKHELDIGLKRLKDYGLDVCFSKYALAGLEFVSSHPELRAKDLIDAFKSDTDMILCAVGGDDTYRLLPYLFDNDELKNVVSDKIFLGFSDSTVNHFMLNKVGLKTFYGQAFLPDVCEIDSQMLPYSRHYFEQLISTGSISEITPSEIWYSSRSDFSVSAVNTQMPKHKNNGFELLRGASSFSGEIFGGCIDTIFDMFDGQRYSDSPELCSKYCLFPCLEEWKGKILLLESSEEQAPPERYRMFVKTLKATGVFSAVNGVLIGKPADEKFFEDYKKIIIEETADCEVPVVANINIGHATPRCIIPFGVKATVDTVNQIIRFER